MIDRNQRIIVEAIRNAKAVKLTIPGSGYPVDIQLTGREVAHDIALAVQSHFNRLTKR